MVNNEKLLTLAILDNIDRATPGGIFIYGMKRHNHVWMYAGIVIIVIEYFTWILL